jgi:hypothetical protein
MKTSGCSFALTACTLVWTGVLAPPALPATEIAGDYLEARTADIYTGPCFANSEVNLAGKEAVLAWHVEQGSWQGVALAGLSVVAALRSTDTLGDPFARALPTHAVLLVDQRATLAQHDALVNFAEAMAGSLRVDVVAVESAPIDFMLPGESTEHSHAMHHAGGAASGLSGAALLKAGSSVELQTRALNANDHLCGNEEIYYPPLTPTLSATPAVTLVHSFTGNELGKTWSSPNKRSAFVARFEL